jgi:hypothetical protein
MHWCRGFESRRVFFFFVGVSEGEQIRAAEYYSSCDRARGLSVIEGRGGIDKHGRGSA